MQPSSKADKVHRARVLASLMLVVMFVMLPLKAQADYSTSLMNRVDRALRQNRRLSGAQCYTAARGVIVLYGKVFDEHDREFAEQTASNVRGVKQVINTLRTMTGQWQAEESRINDTLLLNDCFGVSVRVIGSQAYVSGQVSTPAEEQKALNVISSTSKLEVVNFIRIVPGPIFSTGNLF
jgi:osmotically-inducible protein OsmY